MILTNSAWAGRRIRDLPEPASKDKHGRWTTSHFRGKQGQKLSIINWYRVADASHNVHGINTIYMQQQNDLEKAHNRPLIDPRKAILKDMEKYTRDLIQRGHEVIIVGDTNEHLQKEGNKIDTMLDNLTMINIMQQQHPTTDLPSTYDRGPNCLDMAASTQHVSQHVQAAGFLAFFDPFCTDHRLGYIDLHASKIFGKLPQDSTKTIFHNYIK